MKKKVNGCSVRRILFHALALTLISETSLGLAQQITNYDESAVRRYSLPNLLLGPNEELVLSSLDWEETARPFQFDLLEKFIYGRRLPPVEVSVLGKEKRVKKQYGDVLATRIQATLRMGTTEDSPTTDVLLYLPKSQKKVPVFLKLNFLGNQAEVTDEDIQITENWVISKNGNNRATETSRGSQSRRFPVSSMLTRGYGLATAHCGDFFPDHKKGRAASILGSLGRPTGENIPDDEPGAIGAWAWGLSRILDWLLTLPEVDPNRIIVLGHSRLGKAALWAGACDQRFAMVISNDSGCGGAALSRRNYGESIEVITKRFPHWFCPRLATFADLERELPCDQHSLLAMVAPRPLYIASAQNDRWADPKGEFLAAVAADPAWKLFNLQGLGTQTMPLENTSIGEMIGYHIRKGKHDLLQFDWNRFADFADRKLQKETFSQPDKDMPLDSKNRRLLSDFHPDQHSLPMNPPEDAIIFLGIDSKPKFTAMNGEPLDWAVEDGVLTAAQSTRHMNHLVSTELFQDADIHVEFMTSPIAHGNSGLYIHGHYEMQIYDSFATKKVTQQDEGSLYRFTKPFVNASRPTGEWQVYDIRFIAPRRHANGLTQTPGTLKAWLNGKLVQNGVTFTEPRSPYIPYKHGVTTHLKKVEKTLHETGKGPLFLQDHGSPVRFRNIWIKRLD
ncbi:MAG TPA: hypothetical protein DEB70_05030 [Planctomycetaceae bacterium]|nr:hypothetical protein [Planctomycetaceae bacterium]